MAEENEIHRSLANLMMFIFVTVNIVYKHFSLLVFFGES